jgi:hypothetical protein
MSIAELGALGEFISSMAVVFWIVYLSIQIRSNTRTARASATFDGLHSWAEFNRPMATFSDAFVQAVEAAPIAVPGSLVNRKPSMAG